nr:hypothetical protein [Bacteroidota bacterium]
MRLIKITSFSFLFFLVSGYHLHAQKSGNLELLGSILLDGKGTEGAEIVVLKGNEQVDKLITSSGGKFILTLDLNNVYNIKFSQTGSIVKNMTVDTKVPEEEKSTLFSFKFKVDLFTKVEGLDSIANFRLNKPVAKLKYDDSYDDFNYDEAYSKQRKAELDVVKNDMETLKALRDKEAADLLAKQMADSVANYKVDLEAKNKLAAQQKAEADSLAKLNTEKSKAEIEAAAAAAAAKAKEDEEARLKQLEQDKLNAIAEAKAKKIRSKI